MESKNLKHGLKVSKKDIPLMTSYLIIIESRNYISSVFRTKLEAVNCLTSILSDQNISPDLIELIKVQQLKI